MVGASVAGPCSPESDSSTAGMPLAPKGACCPSVNGKARCANCPPRPVNEFDSELCAASAEATVLRSPVGATSWRVDHGRMIGCWTWVLARSPRTSTASTGPARLAASRIAPAVPWVPLVEASTTLRCSVSPSRSRASSMSMAEPDAAAVAGAPRASRGATITMLPLSVPGRMPTTFSRGTVPSTVRPVKVSTVGADPSLPPPPKPYWASVLRIVTASD